MNYFKNPQSGNVLFYILLAVALFAALSFAVSSTSTTSGNVLTGEQTRLAAQGVISYANTIAAAVQKLRLRGCTESQLNFENNIVSGYTNGGAPSDDSCDIFSTSGGQVQFKAPPKNANDGSDWIITGTNEVTGVGTDGTGEDLILSLENLDSAVCLELNNQLNPGIFSTDPPVDLSTNSSTKFTGTYPSTDTIANVGHGLTGRISACYLETTGGEYNFYKVLLAR